MDLALETKCGILFAQKRKRAQTVLANRLVVQKSRPATGWTVAEHAESAGRPFPHRLFSRSTAYNETTTAPEPTKSTQRRTIMDYNLLKFFIARPPSLS